MSDPTKTEEFINAYWHWFDSLPIEEKKKIWYHPQNYTDTFFYFKIFSRKNNNV